MPFDLLTLWVLQAGVSHQHIYFMSIAHVDT